MTTWQAFLLGIVQGITEFLPVSSSGHLALAQYFLGFDRLQDHILFDLVCHLGTLLAILCFFFTVLKKALSIHSNRFWQVFIGTLPLLPLVLIIKPIKSLFDQPQFLGPCFLISALLIFAGSYLKLSWRFHSPLKWLDALTIGCFQAVAILPGISRSGATISAARFLGWQKEDAIQYSFLLAIPAIIGGTLLEGWSTWHSPDLLSSTQNFQPFIIGFITSFAVGILSLWLLIRLVIKDKWSYFAWYCLALGLAATFYFNLYV